MIENWFIQMEIEKNIQRQKMKAMSGGVDERD